jgi:hypothetical protein
MAVRKTSSGWYIVDKQPLSSGNMLPEASYTAPDYYVLFPDLPLSDIQEGDLLAIAGINTALEYDAVGTNMHHYIGSFNMPWKQIKVGMTMPFSDFEDTDVVPSVAGATGANDFFDDYGDDSCGGVWLLGHDDTDSGRAASGIPARYGQPGDSVEMYVINSANVSETVKYFSADIAIGPKIALSNAYTPTKDGTGKVYLQTQTTRFPFVPWGPGEGGDHDVTFTVPAPGRGMLVVQADGAAGTLARYYFEWTQIVRMGTDAPYLTGLTWYEDMRCIGKDSYTNEPAAAAVPAGALFVYVPKYLEISHEEKVDFLKAGDKNLPLRYTNDYAGYSGALQEKIGGYGTTGELWVRYNLDEVEMFQDGVFPLEVVVIEGEPATSIPEQQ